MADITFNDLLNRIYSSMGVNSNYAAGNTQKDGEETSAFDVDLNAEHVDSTDIQALLDEINELAKELGIDPSSVVDSPSVSDSTNISEAAKKLKDEIDKLQKEKDDINKQMDDLEDHIEDLAQQAEDNIADALAQQEDAFKEHEEESKQVLNEQIAAYIAANKEDGEGMSKDQLQENIKSALPDAPQLAEAMASLATANDQINEIDSCLGDLKSLMNDAQKIDAELNTKSKAYEAELANPTPDTSNAGVNGNGNIVINGDGNTINIGGCCDPIGFTKGEGDDKVKYDFIYDDGNFDSTNDFLGAFGQWDEMTMLNTDGDSKVSAQELKDGNIKAVKTNADGTQEIVDILDEFGDDFSIDLDSYTQGGSHNAVDQLADFDNNGIMDQTLLGTFDVNFGGETLKGYNTLDDVNWLNETYNFNTAESVDPADQEVSEESSEASVSQELQLHENFFNLYTEKSAQLKSELQNAYQELGLTDEQIEAMNEISIAEAQQQTNNVQPKDETASEEPADEDDDKKLKLDESEQKAAA